MNWNEFYTGISPTTFDNLVDLYVDGNRTNTYTEEGSITKPYKTIDAAYTYVNAQAVLAAAAGDFTTARYNVIVSAGEYTDNLTINNPYYINTQLNGAVISGTIDIDTTMQSAPAGGDNYPKLDFSGSTRGNRAYRGKQAQITGKISLTRNNDSLIYMCFAGIDLACDIEAVDAGTWIIDFQNAYGSDSAKSITGTFTDATSYILVESQGQNKLKHTWVGKVIFYNVEGMTFYNINTTPFSQNASIKNSTFNGTVSMPSATAKNLSLDLISYNSFIDTTPTDTNYTIEKLGTETLSYIAKTANYTITAEDDRLECTANSFTITSPTAVGITGKIYGVKNSGTGTITVATTSTQGIDGVTDSSTTLVRWDNLKVMSNGASWIIV